MYTHIRSDKQFLYETDTCIIRKFQSCVHTKKKKLKMKQYIFLVAHLYL